MADPPWPQATIGRFKGRHKRPDNLSYPLLALHEIADLQVEAFTEKDVHLWLWTTNAHLHDAFHILDAWGAKYLTTLTFRKPSGFGAWWVSTTQHILFGYWGKCRLKERYLRTDYEWTPRKHSQKPDGAYRLVERVSFGPYLELFARERRLGWDSIGNEIDGRDIREAL